VLGLEMCATMPSLWFFLMDKEYLA
jgi:hypothetical protein